MNQPEVRLSFPSASGYLVLARTAVAALCARLDYPIDQLEDLKLAVDEACSLLLLDARPQSSIMLSMSTDSSGGLTIEASVATHQGRVPRTTSFTWTVLSSLVESATAQADSGVVTIRLLASRGQPQPTDGRSTAGDPSAVQA